MDAVEKVRQLIEIMAENDLAELELEESDLRIKIRRTEPHYVAAPMPYGPMHHPGGYHPALHPAPEPAEEGTGPAEEEELIEITSPMVGTFFRAPARGTDPYVSIGDVVDAETVVCIVEAMKVMNEIKAEVEGRIAEILIQDAEPVEFGQVLFLVEPLGS
jgi:acetyl-CoA carboxylase biotin carboxyl carrier protein